MGRSLVAFGFVGMTTPFGHDVIPNAQRRNPPLSISSMRCLEGNLFDRRKKLRMSLFYSPPDFFSEPSIQGSRSPRAHKKAKTFRFSLSVPPQVVRVNRCLARVSQVF